MCQSGKGLLRLAVFDKAGTELAMAEGTDSIHLVYDAAYQLGDRIAVIVPESGHYCIMLEDTLGPATVFLTEQAFYWPIPFDEARISYDPRAFEGARHLLSIRRVSTDEIAHPRNLAQNVYDYHGNTTCFPHASANVETRNEAVFAARNAIDGVSCPESHGRYPYQSWGINQRTDAEWHLSFGRTVSAHTLVLTTRADFPHDAWWTQATFELSDGTVQVLSLRKTAEDQCFPLHGRQITSLTLRNLIKADDPSPFPALTQVKVYGMEAE